MVWVHGSDLEDTMSITTLKHHQKSSSMYRFTFGRQTVTVTRRFLPGTASRTRVLRVRVTAETISGQGDGNWTEYRDYTDLHEGDAAFNKHATTLCARWEKESDARIKRATPPAKLPATRSTGVRHAVSEDARTLCRRDATAPADRPALEGKITGRVIGEYAIKVPRGRMGHTDAMLILLQAMRATTGNPHFQALHQAGYADTTTWDQLGEMLRPVASTALHALGATSAQERRDAEEFLASCQPVLSFYEDDEPQTGLPAQIDAQTADVLETRVGRVVAPILRMSPADTREGEVKRLYLMCQRAAEEDARSLQDAIQAPQGAEQEEAGWVHVGVLSQALGLRHLLNHGFHQSLSDVRWEELSTFLTSMIASWRGALTTEARALDNGRLNDQERRTLEHLVMGRRLFLRAVEGVTRYLPPAPSAS